MISDKVRAIPVPEMAAFFNLPPDVISLGLGEPGFSTDFLSPEQRLCGA